MVLARVCGMRHAAYRKVEVEAADGGSSRHEVICFAIFQEVNDLEVEEVCSTMATRYSAEALWMH